MRSVACAWVIEIDGSDGLVTEEDLAPRVAGLAVTQGDRQAAQGLGNPEQTAAITEPALGLNLTHLEVIRVVDGRQRFRKRNRTGAITGDGSSEAECVVRAHQVIAIAKGIELALAMFEAGEVEVAQGART